MAASTTTLAQYPISRCEYGNPQLLVTHDSWAMIVWKHLFHGSSIGSSYQRRYIVVCDLMRHLRLPPAHQLTAISYLTL
eukprot:scaffold14362_cov87-Skeletonema_dohrnii-CCMP3373.AAC.1